MKQLLFIHGGDSFETREEYLRYLHKWTLDNPFTHEERKKWKKQLPEILGKDWVCAFPQMPNAMDATYEDWKLWFEKHIPFMKDGITLIGHSLGGNFLLKYTATNTLPVCVSQMHVVAPGGENEFELPKDLSLVTEQIPQVYIYASEDDPIVPFTHMYKLKEFLPKAEFISFTGRGHFLGEEFPELIERIQRGKNKATR